MLFVLLVFLSFFLFFTRVFIRIFIRIILSTRPCIYVLILIILWDRERVGISIIVVADLLGDPLTDPNGDPLVFIFTHLLGILGALLLSHVLALVMGLVLAGAGDVHPLHVVTLSLPRLLADLPVLSAALSLSVGLAHGHPLGHTLMGLDILVLCIPQGGVLGPALNPMAMVLGAWSCCSQGDTS